MKKQYKRIDNRKPCAVCFSPFRRKIEAMLKNGYSQRVVAEKYQRFFICNVDTLRSKLSRHINHHQGLFKSVMMLQLHGYGIIAPATIEAFAQRLLDHGSRMLEVEPWKFTPRDVLVAQKVLLKKRALVLNQNAMQSAIARMFGRVGLEKHSDRI